MSKSSKSEFRLEEGLKRLSEIVKALEENKISLEDSIKIFEEGVSLTKQCHQVLNDAEQKIELLTKADKNSINTAPLKSLEE
jgi:exodeoxyribonuclease VII small subunit